MDNDKALRQHLIYLLTEGGAHIGFDDAVKNMPFAKQGKVPEGGEHSPWQLLEHIRIALWDILEFSRNSNHVSPKWPEKYWPAKAVPPSKTAWNKSVAEVGKLTNEMVALVKDDSTDLFAKIPHGDGQTILREALLVADHNAYHLGQLVEVRRALGAWK